MVGKTTINAGWELLERLQVLLGVVAASQPSRNFTPGNDRYWTSRLRTIRAPTMPNSPK
jgi:hypothetical protein